MQGVARLISPIGLETLSPAFQLMFVDEMGNFG